MTDSSVPGRKTTTIYHVLYASEVPLGPCEGVVQHGANRDALVTDTGADALLKLARQAWTKRPKKKRDKEPPRIVAFERWDGSAFFDWRGRTITADVAEQVLYVEPEPIDVPIAACFPPVGWTVVERESK